MRKPLWATLAVTLLLGAGTIGLAQETSAGAQKPLLTVSFAGYDQLLGNIKAVGELAGKPELAKALDGMLVFFTQGKGLAGLDKTRPWGVVVSAGDEEKFPVQAFVPVTDLKQLMALVPNLETGEPYAPDAKGVYEVKGKGQTGYIMQKGQWAFIVDNRDALKSLPDDPAALLGDLTKKYLLGVRASVKNLPTAAREKGIAAAKGFFQMFTMRQPAESDDQYAVRRKVSDQSFEQLVALIKDLDEATYGLGFDSSAGSLFVEFEMTALAGTQSAQRFALNKEAKTNFAGLLLPGAALSIITARPIDDAEVAQTKSMLGNLRTTAGKDLEANEDLSQEQRQLAKQLLGDVLDVLDKTLDNKKIDAGGAVLLDAGTPTVVAASMLADGTKLDKVLKQLVTEAGKDQPDIAKLIKLDAESYEGIKFHVATLPVPDEDAAAILGKTLDIVVGIGEESIYLGVGKDAMATLKKVIDGSKKEPGKAVPPVQASLSGVSIAKFVAQVAPPEEVKAIAGKVAELLSKSPGKDHVTVVAKAIPNGVNSRLTLEEGILKTIMAFAAPGAGPGAGPGPSPKAKKSDNGGF